MARVGPQTAAAEMIPRGRYIGKRVDDPPKDEAEHSSVARPAQIIPTVAASTESL